MQIVIVAPVEANHQLATAPSHLGLRLAAATPPRYRVNVLHPQTPAALSQATQREGTALYVLLWSIPLSSQLVAWMVELAAQHTLLLAWRAPTPAPVAQLLEFCDAVVVGDIQRLWGRLLADAESQRLLPCYAEIDIGAPVV
ncbi:MAG: hypothetical protein R3C14_11720 [Caldilineaceae bacterium]